MEQTHGYVRCAVVTPRLVLGAPHENAQEVASAVEALAQESVQVAVFPELCLTGYSCADLFFQRALLDAALEALDVVAAATAEHGIAVLVGLPCELGGRLFNCAAFVSGGRVQGVVPKTFIPNRGEFYERRWFAPASALSVSVLSLGEQRIPVGTDILFRASNVPGCVLGVELCEDLWCVEPPSGKLALAGATVLANLSASDELLGKRAYRDALVRQQSGRALAAYLYASAGPWESSTDVVYSGHGMIAENGSMLVETERFSFETCWEVADVDVDFLTHERLSNSSFSDGALSGSYRVVEFVLPGTSDLETELEDTGPVGRPVTRQPFVPHNEAMRDHHCEEIFTIQATALSRRIRHIGLKSVTIGVSGGLDSTLALLVCVRAFDMMGLPRSGIVAVTMPGFGTTGRTRGNAEVLCNALGVPMQEIPIGDSVRQHFADIGHDPAMHDVTFENAQARERTQVLMDVANKTGGIVVGTGDLSEAALGWCTFNGDHMSMYHVNIGVPKTLVKYLIGWVAEQAFADEASETLHDIIATPITPELLPVGEDGELVQQTEDSIGPYELHDFFLFHVIRHGFAPAKVYFLATFAFEGAYSKDEILKWLREFYRRFFASQFKRSAMPDGPKVGTVALSPRGDWRMPSDASAQLWLQQVEEL